MIEGDAFLRLRGVNRSWGSRQVIHDADLDISEGTVAWIGGANGVGKTTLLRMIAGLIEADGGRIELLGLHPLQERRAYQRLLGWLPAGNGGLYNRLSVRQNLQYAAAVGLVPRAARRSAVDEVIARFALKPLAAQRADRISMGERQRVRLAMTFAHRPRLVVLDEPHTSLDEATLGRLGDALDLLMEAGGSAIWCSPDRDNVSLPADQEYVVESGKPVRRC